MKSYTVEDIEVFNKLLNLNMDEKRKEAVLPTFQDWMDRAEALDQKMSQKPYADIIPSNVFKQD